MMGVERISGIKGEEAEGSFHWKSSAYNGWRGWWLCEAGKVM